MISNARGGAEEVYENQGGGKFKLLLQARGWDDPIAIGDFNNDGLLDLAVGSPGDTITIYLNQTTQPGRSVDLYPRMEKPNPFAVGARVEVFRAGELGKAGAKPFWVEKAHADGTPIHVGMGSATKFDLRVIYPGKIPVTVEKQGVEVKQRLRVYADGKIEG